MTELSSEAGEIYYVNSNEIKIDTSGELAGIKLVARVEEDENIPIQKNINDDNLYEINDLVLDKTVIIKIIDNIGNELDCRTNILEFNLRAQQQYQYTLVFDIEAPDFNLEYKQDKSYVN